MNPFAIIIGFALLVGSVFYVAAPFRLDEKRGRLTNSKGHDWNLSVMVISPLFWLYAIWILTFGQAK